MPGIGALHGWARLRGSARRPAGRLWLMQVGEAGQQPGPAPRTTALDGAFCDAEHGRGVSDRIVQHVDKDQGNLLIMRKLAKRLHHLQRDFAAVRWIGRTCRCEHVEQAFVATRNLRPCLPAAHAVQTGIHHNTVQPCRDRRIAAEARRSPEGGDHSVLQRISGVLRVGQRPYRHRPQPVPVANEQLAERIRVAIDVQAQQLAVGVLATVTRGWA